jgi:hypothetical protein
MPEKIGDETAAIFVGLDFCDSGATGFARNSGDALFRLGKCLA